MAVANLLGGFLQGFAQARDQKLQRQQQQDLIKFKTDQFKKEQEAALEQQEAMKKLGSLLMPQPNPHSQAGNAPAKPKKSLSDFMVDPELQALLLKSGQMDMGDMMKEVGMQKQRDQTSQIMQSLGIGMPGGNGPSFQGGGAVEFGGATVDPSTGKLSLSLKPKAPQGLTETVNAQPIIEGVSGVESVVSWLTNDKGVAGKDFASSIDGPKLWSLVIGAGPGKQYRDTLIGGVTASLSQRAGKTLTGTEMSLFFDTYLPKWSDIAAAFDPITMSFNPNGMSDIAADKLNRLYGLLTGSLNSKEVLDMAKAAGIDTSGWGAKAGGATSQGPSKSPAKSSPLPERKVIRFEDLPDG